MNGAIASILHIASLAAGLACLFSRSYFIGGSLLGRLHAGANRFVDLAMMMPGRGPQLSERPLDEAQMRRALTADTLSLVAGTVWVGSGLWRLTGLDKATDWYMHNDLFLLKMALVGLMFTLEMVPMLVFIQWRYALGYQQERARRDAAGDATPIPRSAGMNLFLRAGETPNLAALPPLRRVLLAEELLLLTALCVAPFMARGVGYDTIFGPAPVSAEPCAVTALLDARCGRCHRGTAAQAGFDLALGPAALVDAPSSLDPGAVRVRPGDLDGSLLFAKISGTQKPTQGLRMPLGAALPDAEIAAVRAWIAAGAAPCTAP